jgi:predicted DNA-binding protein (MmcQ/YjbR family)
MQTPAQISNRPSFIPPSPVRRYTTTIADNPAFDRPVVRKLRSICLAFPETTEKASWGHPNFRAGKRTFAAFEIVGGRPSIAFRLPPSEIASLLRRKPFFATPYGRNLWASVWADRTLDWKVVDSLLRKSYRTVALKRMIKALDA